MVDGTQGPALEAAYDYCAELVREQDADRYVASLFAPETQRRHLFALYAFNVEISRIAEQVNEPMAGEIRLQWWRDVVREAGHGDVEGSPVALALMDTVHRCALPFQSFDQYLEARRFDLYNDPMPSLHDATGYLGETVATLMNLAAMVLLGREQTALGERAGHAGMAVGLVGMLRSLALHKAQKRVYLPADIMARHGYRAAHFTAGEKQVELGHVIADILALAEEHWQKARAEIANTPDSAGPAFLIAALVPFYAKALAAKCKQGRPLEPISLALWRRQWCLWRAARAETRLMRRAKPGL